MKTFLKCLVVVSVLILLVSGYGQAMGGMYTAKFVDGSNLVIMTNNAHNTQAGIPINYNLRLYDMEGKPITFSNIQMELRHGDKTLLSQNLRRSVNDDASFEHTFAKQGAYNLVVHFMDNDKHVAQGEFPLVVNKGVDEGFLADAFTPQTAVAFGLGVGAYALAQSRGRLKRFHQKSSATKKS